MSVIGVGSDYAKKLALYSIGGNALSDPSKPKDLQDNGALKLVLEDVIDLLEAGFNVVLTHGNGPQVGDLLALEESGLDSKRVRTDLSTWVAATQGMIGHELSMELDSLLDIKSRPERTAVVLTRVLVDENDFAFVRPTKPVGPVLDKENKMINEWKVVETEKGLRRVVASPHPIEVLDLELISKLVDLGAVVICGGGGGIPIAIDGTWKGVPSVIDKDRFSALLTISLEADVFITSTAVEHIEIGYGTKNSKKITEITLNDLKKLFQNGEFPEGSMGPKVEAMMSVVKKSEKTRVVLCSPGNALKTLRWESGTNIIKG
jgi:carbamate kinase|tara:strand:- start:1772 stop:2728 length:957 start_codon:yes stop_codon:yes gene_type:complete